MLIPTHDIEHNDMPSRTPTWQNHSSALNTCRKGKIHFHPHCSNSQGVTQRSTVTDEQLCCHWNGNTFPFVVLHQNDMYQALPSWPGLLPYSPDRPEKTPGFSLSGTGDGWKQHPGGKKQMKLFEHDPAQLSSRHQNFCRVQNSRTGPRIMTQPQPEVACAFPSQDVTCLDTCLGQLFLLKA